MMMMIMITIMMMTTTQPAVTPSSLSRRYLNYLGHIYLIAFLSYYVQYPALSSRSGIEPAELAFQRAYPWLYLNIVESGYCDADSFVELLNVLGVILSVVIASGLAHHGTLYLAVTATYRFLVILGGSFYTFQWDILLVEAGFLTGICFAPWITLTLLPSSDDGNNNKEQQVGSWPIRFLLFKLMLMSGIVKIQANCPTWNNLTALEYHFATQPLSGPLAWYAHQLPPILLRLGVAATFIIEIPAAFLLVCPFVTMRKVGSWMQILLQLLIILTGIFNFFNLLTMALCLPCMIGDIPREKVRSFYHRIWSVMQIALCAIFLTWACSGIFAIERIPDVVDPERLMVGLKLVMTNEACNAILERAVPITVACTLIFTIATGVRSTFKKTTNRLSSCTHCLVCCICITLTSLPFIDLTPNFKQTSLGRIMSVPGMQNAQRYSNNIFHGYGLFRRMTGVGSRSIDAVDKTGWAGMQPSIVARPEIIVEALIGDSEEWRELNFRWKPGRIDVFPRQVAPHQPRFDWRMWFAALSTAEHNPWFVSFIQKILDECGPVLNLLDEPEIAAGTHNITLVRASLYHYDFTRLDSEWARQIPGAKVTNTNTFLRIPEQVWNRKLVRQYLPPLESSNPSLREYLEHARLRSTICLENKDRCSDVDPAALSPCRLAKSLRRLSGTSWMMSLLAFFSCFILYRYCNFCQSRRRIRKLKLD